MNTSEYFPNNHNATDYGFRYITCDVVVRNGYQGCPIYIFVK